MMHSALFQVPQTLLFTATVLPTVLIPFLEKVSSYLTSLIYLEFDR